MHTVLRIAAILAVLSSLSACVVVPAPYYDYGPRYERHHDHHRDWDRRW